MATGGLYGSSLSGTLIAQPGTDSVGLYGSSIPYGGTYFEWFIFQQSATAPATPTGGSWNFTTNVGTPPTGWTQTPPVTPTNIVWVSIAFVNSKTGSTFTWSAPATWVQLGTSGFSGYSGKSGYSGYSGTNGASGTSGYSGTNGASGTSGYSGYSGYSGSGISGYSGYSGSGTSGYSGFSGISGFSGAVGTSGYSGISGANGASGTSGYSGYSGSGISGFSGYSGYSGTNGSGSGSVTSVAMTVPSFMSVTGSPITTSGTLAVTATTSGANSIVLRDTNQNISANSITEGFSSVAAAGTTTTLTVGSSPNFVVTGSGGQTYKLPDATTLPNGAIYTFNNNQSSGTIVVTNNSGTTISTIQSGGFVEVILLSNAIAAGSWDVHNFAPSNVSWSTNTLDYAGSITSATWNGATVATNRGGTGLTSFTSGGVVYASSTSALATGSALTFDGTNFATTGSATATRFIPSGSTVATNGMYLPAANSLGFSTNSTERMRIGSSGNFGYNTASLTNVGHYSVFSNLTDTNAYGYLLGLTAASATTSSIRGFNTSIGTAASSFTLTQMFHYLASQTAIGASSAVTNQYGFSAESSLTGATNNYGFYGNLASGTGRYNLYMAGTADNYLAGSLGIGQISVAGASLSVRKNITGGTTGYGVLSYAEIESDVTSAANMFQAFPTTQATAFTLSALRHYYANQSTIGAGSTVTSQFGFYAESTLTGATNNYGFYGAIASGTGRYNLYMAGTADNYLGGSVGIGATTTTGYSLVISKNITGATIAYSAFSNGVVQSDVTTLAGAYTSALGTAASAFTLASLRHFYAAQGTIGAGSTVTNQYGFFVDAGLTGATNNYGFFGNIASGTGRWNFYAGGTAQNFFNGDVITNGKIGLGTASSPSYGTSGQVLTSGGSAAAPTWTTISGGGSSISNGTSNVTVNSSGGTVTIATAGTTALTVDTSQNVGIGVTPGSTSASGTFQMKAGGDMSFLGNGNISSNTYYNGTNYIYATTAASTRYRVAAGQHEWYNAPSGTAGTAITFTQAMTLDASGNLGIGTSSPTQSWTGGSAKVQQLQGVSSQVTVLRVNEASGTYGDLQLVSSGSAEVGVYNFANGALRFGTNGSERMRIDSSGRLLVNLTSNLFTNSKIQVTGSAGPTLGIQQTTSTEYVGGFWNYAGSSTYLIGFFSGSAGGGVGSITYNGSSVLYNTTSDQRLKENIQDADSASSLVDALQVRKFDWKESSIHQRYGFIAQELVTVAPEAVHQPANEEEMMAVDYSKLVPMLVKEIQSLRKRLTALEIK